jgi:hypothetical protein
MAGAPLVAGAPGGDPPRGLPAWVVAPVVTFKDARSASENAETRLSGSLPAVDFAADFPCGADHVTELAIGIVLGTSTIDSISSRREPRNPRTKERAAPSQYAVFKYNNNKDLLER